MKRAAHVWSAQGRRRGGLFHAPLAGRRGWPAGLVVLAVAAMVGCRDPQGPTTPPAESAAERPAAAPVPRLSIATAPAASPIRLAAVARAAGIDFIYYGGPSAEHYMTEQNGGGVALLDFDRDGRPDIFFPNGSHFRNRAEEAGKSHRLYRAVGPLRYDDVSRAAGLDGFGFGMGCAAGDYDNDGFVDLYLAQYGRNRLWHNNGDGTFSEVTEAAGVGDARWGTSAAFADLDRDGNLDLYVVNYVDWSEHDPPCYTQHQPPVHISCGPIGRTGQPDVLYHNLGDGSFADVSNEAGIVRPEPKGLGLAIADFDTDGWLDVYVANDTTENYLFRNLGGMRFQDLGIERGAAVGADGLAHSGMGIACGDYNGDGHFDLLVTNFDNELNDLYQNLGEADFLPVNTTVGLDPISRHVLGFGSVFADFDLDGWPDLFVANGHVWDLTSLGLGYTYQMPQQVIRNVDGQRFVDGSQTAGDYFAKPCLGRAVASGDLDGDGDEDLVVTHLDAPHEVLRNDTPAAGRGVSLELIGSSAARQPLGCRVEVTVKGQRRVYWLAAGGSFQAASDQRLIVAVGDAETIDELTVHWPDGHLENRRQVPVAARLVVRQGPR